MAEPPAAYPFEQFPRRRLPLGITRDKLWSVIQIELEVSDGLRDGGVAFKLADLGEWPDEKLALIIPLVIPGCKIFIKHNFAYATPPKSHQSIQLFPLSSPAAQAFNTFDGINLLAEIASTVARTNTWDDDHAFAYCRGLFLSLVTLGICQPKMEVS
jgi:hypothetical protein